MGCEHSVNSKGSALLPRERQAAGSLALIYLVRMVGLFIILPVFSLHAGEYENATPAMIGLALGIYGLMQALMQIPFGFVSDRIGRKPVIVAGLALLVLGSVIAARAETIEWVVFGRALQGSGAISSVLMALAADLSRDEVRTRVMAALGVSVGLSFMVAILLGPLLLRWTDFSGLFWFTAASGVVAVAVLYLWVPTPQHRGFRTETSLRISDVGELLANRNLLRLDLSIMILHAAMTASFVALPLAFAEAGLETGEQGKLYLPALLLAVPAMVPLMIHAERRAMRPMLLLAVGLLLLTQLLWAFLPPRLLWHGVVLWLFFTAMTALEALLPSLVSRLAPSERRGTAMGVYSSSQFLGTFVGGVLGGWLYGQSGHMGLHLALALLCGVWLLVIRNFVPPIRRAESAPVV